jgi:hypothetical protein
MELGQILACQAEVTVGNSRIAVWFTVDDWAGGGAAGRSKRAVGRCIPTSVGADGVPMVSAVVAPLA